MARPPRGDKGGKKPLRLVSVGHDGIDSGHEEIVDCCNQIAESTSSALEFQLHRLRTLLASHFENEERLLKAAGSRLCGCHARDHALFLELCDHAIDENRKEQKASRRVIFRELIPALREHIAYRDQLIALHLNSISPGISSPLSPRES